MKLLRASGWVAIGVISGALVAGCAATSGAHTTSRPRPTKTPLVVAAPVGPSACDVVTEDDATAALGTDPGEGVASTNYSVTSCVFGAYPAVVLVSIDGLGGKDFYEHARSDPGAGTVADVPGLGNGAFSVTNPPSYEIAFYKGDTFVDVGLVSSGTAPLAAPTLTLATAIAGRL